VYVYVCNSKYAEIYLALIQPCGERVVVAATTTAVILVVVLVHLCARARVWSACVGSLAALEKVSNWWALNVTTRRIVSKRDD
jgi:hypothetical protein